MTEQAFETVPTSVPAFVADVERALTEIAAGHAVVVVDDHERENEGDLIFAAECATTELVAFTIRHGSGVLCVPMAGERLDALRLPPMCTENEDPKGTAYAVSVDARDGVSTGISAADRARTIRLLAAADTRTEQLTRPGHVFPLRARPGGVLERPGHTEAAIDLTDLAGMRPAGAICEIVNDDGSMARGTDLDEFCSTHGLHKLAIADLVRYRRWTAPIASSPAVRLPTPHGIFEAVAVAEGDGTEHLVLTLGDVADQDDVLVRVHSECLTGDVFGSQRCDCGPQLDQALAEIARVGAGVVVYLRGHEGRGIGLVQKLRAYGLQERGYDTVDANTALGLPVDARDFATAAKILADLRIRSVNLMSNNPHKESALAAYGTRILRTTPLHIEPTPDNVLYLQTKTERLGHRPPVTHPVATQHA
ncbi:bifunctional 3,4-dihydroxy-2-butanone-4-phosphate synthase/GTP cyclohydrolase II [Rhodococcus sp. T2V]|uniref:bifunctional 3,4-dihydroxy-2-butanone-4-phosphate synthase/GTP cyclohydrolase II n=1 Tax=Rhodococcus sp. T2V TaxID=3034164 RepID=UPI0023E19A04|nr:bifunctional 3,4-dihydroxy-2-butanone-4-phosphate synthase/GTP cyclohydrolase II [Rhodococcus sp. T2V]MDF3307018.1 bifunctional 3,4-dihydroxy-2-butanone-4-phosphate synthase/GTP cyclohydrolase II [Rhodococcus sp. T2V]